MQNDCSYPMESDGGIDGHTSDTGVVPSDDTSSWVIGWCTRNLDVNNKLERENKTRQRNARNSVRSGPAQWSFLELYDQPALKRPTSFSSTTFPWSLTPAGRSWHTWVAPQCCSAGETCNHTSGSGNPGKAASGRNRRRPTWRRSSSPAKRSTIIHLFGGRSTPHS